MRKGSLISKSDSNEDKDRKLRNMHYDVQNTESQ